MENFKNLTSRLAFQADKKILNAEEEEHFRVDISAHEHVQMTRVTPSHGFIRFGITAVLIYLVLFIITNASAYSQIFMASLQDFLAANTATETVAGLATEIVGGPATETAEDNGKVAVIRSTDEMETAGEALTKDDGILPLLLTPSTYENQIRIPSIGVNSHIVEPEQGLEALISNDWNDLEDQIRSSLLRGVVHYPGTAEPGKKGNAFLTGHSSNVFWDVSPYNTVFALLPRIEVAADIYVTYNQTEYHYRVTETKEVSPKDIGVLAQTDSYQLTIMTCTPVGTTLRRFIVIAELVED